MTDQKNTLLAIVLSALVLSGWQIFFGLPQREKQKQVKQQQAQERSQPAPGAPAQPQTGAPPAPTTAPQAPAAAQIRGRDAVLADSARVRIDTPSLIGSIALKGGRID